MNTNKNTKKEHHEPDYLEQCARWSKQRKEAQRFAKACGLDKKAKKEAAKIWKEKMDAIHLGY